MRAQLWSALTERLALKATAFVLAVMLWLVSAARQPTQEYVSVLVVPELDGSMVLQQNPPPLRALVAGSAGDILKLYSSPPAVRRLIRSEARDSLVFDVLPGDVRMPAGMNGQLRVLDVQPRSVTLRFATRGLRRARDLAPGTSP